jgi:hypothetical protein
LLVSTGRHEGGEAAHGDGELVDGESVDLDPMCRSLVVVGKRQVVGAHEEYARGHGYPFGVVDPAMRCRERPVGGNDVRLQVIS